jgi:hypothetical protein
LNSRRPYLSWRLAGLGLALIVAAGLVAISSFAFGTSTASAAVQVDPNGPAGQQYALPLDSVRGESAGKPSAGVPGAASPAPLFGEGIRPAGKSGNSGRDGLGDKNDPNGNDLHGVDGMNGVDDPEANPRVAALINGTGGGSSSTLEMILLIGGMALVGLTAGLIGRRTL